MTEETALLEKRAELKRQLVAGEYKTLVDVILDGTGRFIQKLTRNPEPLPFWYSAVVIALVTLLIGFFTSILLGEFYSLRREMILFDLVTVGIVLAFVIAGRIYFDIVFAICDHLLDAIESVADLANLQRWLAAIFNIKKQLFFSLAYVIFFSFYVSISFVVIIGDFAGFGSTILVVIVNFQGGMIVYYLLPAIALPARLSRYQFKLYAADPSSSEVIDHLSDMLNSFVYVTAVLVTIATLIFAFLEVLILANIIIMVLLFWGPLAIFFIINQYALRKIITRAKWKTINEIQAEVEELQAGGKLTDKETMEALNRLMDYHNRIRATPNSALNLRATLSFLNSLLLPLLAFVLANLDEVLGLFS
jgi:hypothetical protein